jgi:20S proteasome subunit beta 3
VSPIVCGLENGKPIIGNYDFIGCLSISHTFETAGTAGNMLMGAAETFFKKDMDPETLEEMIAQVLTSGLDRDASSGWGALVFILTEKDLKIKQLKVKMT